jgi:K+:H+ antiporter
MPHDAPLIATIVAGLGLAFIFGAIAQQLRLPPLVGYLIAGVAVGPFTPGFVADQKLAGELAELGVILLMFGVGLHFSFRELLSVRAIALPGAIVQIAVATCLGLGLALLMGWTAGAGLVFGLALSVASTVVLIRAIQERRLMETERGRIAVGWLIVEDLAMVLALVLLPALASFLGGNTDALVADPLAARFGLGFAGVLLLTLIKVGVFVGIMLIVGRRVIPWVLHYIAHTGSRELFRLGVLAIALCVAFGAASCSACRWPWALSLREWFLASRRSVNVQLRNRCRCGMRSRFCSSSPSACCSIRQACYASRGPWPPPCSSSSSASPSPPSSSCSRSAILPQRL